MEQKKWYQQKTFWAGAGIVMTGVSGFFTDLMTPEQTQAVMTIFGGLAAIFLRDAVSNIKK